MSTPDLAPPSRLGGVVAVWVTALVVGVVIGILVPAQWRSAWLAVGLGGLVVASFAVQLVVGRSHGFIRRCALSMLGAFLVLGVVSAGFGLAVVTPA